MKKLAIISGLLLPLCFAGTAQTVENPASSKPLYVSLKIGASIPRDSGDENLTFSFDNAVNVSAAVGMRLHPTMRLELEGSYRKNDIEEIDVLVVSTGAAATLSGNFTTKALLFNAYYDFPVADSTDLLLALSGMSLRAP